MRIKLNRTEFKDLYQLLKEVAEIEKPKSFERRIEYIILLKLYKTFYQRDFEERKVYSVTIPEEQSIAFWLYFMQELNEYPITTSKGNILNRVLSNIHQQYI